MSPATPFSLCVFCGSRSGDSPLHGAAADALGAAIGRSGSRLVYGGGDVGLMGRVADATLAAGGQVIGVIPEALMRREVGHHGLTELHVVQTMHQRKQLMAERADAFVALPGGIGTLEELFEVWTWRQLGYHDKPVGLLNVDGYFDALLQFLDRSVSSGFLDAAQRAVPLVDTQPQRLLQRLQVEAGRASAPDDYRRI